MSLSTEEVDVSAGRTLSAFAGESASLVSGRVSVTAAESLSVSTKDFGFVASGSFGIDVV